MSEAWNPVSDSGQAGASLRRRGPPAPRRSRRRGVRRPRTGAPPPGTRRPPPRRPPVRSRAHHGQQAVGAELAAVRGRGPRAPRRCRPAAGRRGRTAAADVQPRVTELISGPVGTSSATRSAVPRRSTTRPGGWPALTQDSSLAARGPRPPPGRTGTARRSPSDRRGASANAVAEVEVGVEQGGDPLLERERDQPRLGAVAGDVGEHQRGGAVGAAHGLPPVPGEHPLGRQHHAGDRPGRPRRSGRCEASSPRSRLTTGLCWVSASVAAAGRPRAPRRSAGACSPRRGRSPRPPAGRRPAPPRRSGPPATARIRARSPLTGASTQRRSSSAPTTRTRTISDPADDQRHAQPRSPRRSPRCARTVRASMSRLQGGHPAADLVEGRLAAPGCTSRSARRPVAAARGRRSPGGADPAPGRWRVVDPVDGRRHRGVAAGSRRAAAAQHPRLGRCPRR